MTLQFIIFQWISPKNKNFWYNHSTMVMPNEKSNSNSKETVAKKGNGNPLQYSCLENPMDGGAWWAAVHEVARSQTQLGNFTFTFHFHALEKEMATRSSVLAWRIPGTREPGGLPSMGSHRVGHDWSDLAAAAAAGCFSNINIMQELSVSSEGRHPGFECCLPNCDFDKKNHTF